MMGVLSPTRARQTWHQSRLSPKHPQPTKSSLHSNTPDKVRLPAQQVKISCKVPGKQVGESKTKNNCMYHFRILICARASHICD